MIGESPKESGESDTKPITVMIWTRLHAIPHFCFRIDAVLPVF
jgi:hypothetical protein